MPTLANRGYMICTTSRTGSTYLCQLLSSTGVLGKPTEYFNVRGMRRRHDETYPSDRRLQLDMIRTRGGTSNGIYGVKVIAPQMPAVCKQVDPFRHLPNLAIVRLRRRDVLGQAISLACARQTGQFYASDAQRTAPAYSADMIRHCLRSVRQQEAIWEQVLTQHSLKLLTITYEDVLDDPQKSIDQIATLVGLASPVSIERALVTLKVQRDTSTTEWRQRFLAETGGEKTDTIVR